jgi:hypothetical protein
MMTEPSDVAELLTGTPLADLPTGHGPRGTILVSDVRPDELFAAWHTAYALVPITGRWPVMVTDWGGDLRVRARPDAALAESDLLAFDRAAQTVDPWPSFPRWDDRLLTAGGVSSLAHGFSGVSLSEEATRQAPSLTTEENLDRWIYERVLSDSALTARVFDGTRYVVRTDYWYTPDNVSLLMLPTASPWLAPKWIGFFGALGREQELAAVLWQWYRRWDARLVASWDTMLQFTVHRRPAPGEDAWELAGQLKALARNLNMHRWELAIALPEGDAWFIHNRP